MGKLDEEGVPVTSSSSSLSAADSSSTDSRGGRGCRSSAIRRVLSLKCFLSVVFSLAVIVSSVFWLLSYIQGADREDLVLWHSGGKIVCFCIYICCLMSCIWEEVGFITVAW